MASFQAEDRTNQDDFTVGHEDIISVFAFHRLVIIWPNVIWAWSEEDERVRINFVSVAIADGLKEVGHSSGSDLQAT